MTASEIRQGFLDFFASKQHTIVKSAPIIPDNDATLLFTNAGMNQFKDVFLNTGTRPYKRAADTQKCMRVSGKHNDLDDVGKDTYHHTLFEMLGNWSFGDYYKKEAIEWAWELLTGVWKLPKAKLYATVYNTDDEAAGYWASVTDIDKSHILKFGDKDNFWEMGETGPCGPCSEIHIDRGEGTCDKQHVPGHVCAVNAGCSRFIELWNLVFIQYNREADRTLNPLPAKHVDTGMGFERIVAVIQGKFSNYDSDLFTPIITKVEGLSGKEYRQKDGLAPSVAEGMPFRVIADHIRALTFALADGVMPSNEGRGYVIRKILRRAARYGKILGFDAPFLNLLVDTVVEAMGQAFPEVAERAKMVKGLIFSEEDSFFRTLNKGMDRLQAVIAKVRKSGGDIISGEDVFLLYDSLGFPVDFTQQVAIDENLKIDMDRFRALMESQKERARASWKGFAFDFKVVAGIAEPSEYTGETENERDEKVTLLVKENKLADKVNEGDDVVIIVPKTPFYGEKGGQVGDTGIIENSNCRVYIIDTKIYDDAYLHIGHVEKGTLAKGDTVTLKVDIERKNAIARNHTATHLLHRALRETVGEHAAQAGSLVSPERLRFDFTHPKALTKEEIETIENKVNEAVLKNLPVTATCMNQDEAKRSGAVAIFEEKYGDVVRVIEVQAFSKELCGGTHVHATGDIGLVKVVSEASISAGTRRIEAVTGMNSLAEYRNYFYEVKELAGLLKIDDAAVPERAAQLLTALRDKDKEIEALRRKSAAAGMGDLMSRAADIAGFKVLIEKVDMDTEALVAAVDQFRGGADEGAIFLVSEAGGKAVLAAGVTKGLTAKLKAGDIARETAKILGGGGGGRPDFAQAGGKDVSKIPDAIKKAGEMIRAALK
ncbi:MAG: alanine--tRNA ligase [Spirochaetes bacterium GWF1_51_8]|nr:MAG: alanine--tRNA ligase [Spirochaetes bacterium GWF1_51_8]